MQEKNYVPDNIAHWLEAIATSAIMTAMKLMTNPKIESR